MMNKTTFEGAQRRRLHTLFAVVTLAIATFVGGAYGSAEAAEWASSDDDALYQTQTDGDTSARSIEEKVSNAIDMNELCGLIDEKADASKIDSVLALAHSFKGTPYAYGGTTPRGFDCSGFVLYCMREGAGIEMPRTAAAQASLGQQVPVSEAQPGDLLFWGSGSSIYHVGISLGDGTYIHASGHSKGVCIQSVASYAPTFAKHIL